jgi:hypothetical protein
VHYVEDRYSHAKVHNEVLRAKQVVVLGGTFDALQVAQATRTYLDDVGKYETKIMVINGEENSEVRKTLGSSMDKWLKKQLKQQRITYQPNARIVKLEGDVNLDRIVFNEEGDHGDEKVAKTDFFVEPDVVIVENGIGRPKKELLSMVGHQDMNSEKRVHIETEAIPGANIRFSLIHNDIHSAIFAAGSATNFPAFMAEKKLRIDNPAYNIEASFFAAMNMLDKKTEFRYIPHTFLNINDIPVHFVGEPNHNFIETIVEGDPKSDKFIVWYVMGTEVVGFATVGYTNLHLYLWEAMKLLVMPTATQLRRRMVTHKHIVANVLQCRPDIYTKRKLITKIDSVIRAEFTREREQLDKFKQELKENIRTEKTKLKDQFDEMKAKYDQDGVEVIDDESQIGAQQQQAQASPGPVSDLEHLRDVNDDITQSRRGSAIQRRRGNRDYKVDFDQDAKKMNDAPLESRD